MASACLLTFTSAKDPRDFWVTADTLSQQVLSVIFGKLHSGPQTCPGVWEPMPLEKGVGVSAEDFV